METIYGNLQGLKSSHIKQLQQLYDLRQPGDRLTTPEFAQRLAAISTEIHQPVCSYINRRGQVIRVAVGTPAQTQIPPLELPRHGALRLSGIHCLATQLKAEIPDAAALTAMARQRLDALVILIPTGRGAYRGGDGATGYVKEAYLAHLVPDLETPWIVSPPLSLDALTEQDFDDLVHEWETEFQESGFETSQFQEISSDRDRVLLVGLMTEDMSPQRFQDGLEELARLVESAGGEVLATVQQK
jgi:GTP-binding protein HflX